VQAIKALASVRKMLSPVVRPMDASVKGMPEQATLRTSNMKVLAVSN
jgi:hypothetical protein